MTKPTDAEIIALLGDRQFSTIGAVREALRRWGTPPAGAGEPVATLHCNQDCYVWARATEAGKRLRFEEPMNLYTTPQPTQAQAGAVPLTDEQLAEMMRETWGCASIAPRHAIGFARAIERAHGIGIKGGQHGAE